MKNRFQGAVFFTLILMLQLRMLTCQERPADPSIYFDDDRLFYADTSGYHGLGIAEQTDSEEAGRLAKADALRRVFTEIGKDELFLEIFITAWPESIKQEDFSILKNASGTTVYAVRILVDRNAVALTERLYSENVRAMLDRVEIQNSVVQDLVVSGLKAEENLLLEEAFTLFRQAGSGCAGIRTALKKVQDNSILSVSGLNRSSILQITASLEQSAREGIARIETAKSVLSVSEKAVLSEETLRLLDAECADLHSRVSAMLDQSPFYDLPKEKLASVRIELDTISRKSAMIRRKLETLTDDTGDTRRTTRERVTLVLEDLDREEAHVLRMKTEVAEELRYPRLKRQEDARKRAEFNKKLGSLAAWLFTHDPKDLFSIRWDLPFGFTSDAGWNWKLDSGLSFTVEAGSRAGFWFSTSLNYGISALRIEGMDYSVQEWTHALSLGVMKESLFGVGYGWTWVRDDVSNGEAGPLAASQKIFLHFGSVDADRLRPAFLFTFAYTLPEFTRSFILPYHLNAEIHAVLRLENILIFEAGVSTGCIDLTALDSGESENPVLVYDFGWNAGLAFRLPGPFAWGVRYSGRFGSSLQDGMPSELTAGPGIWKGYIQYSF